MNSSMFVAIDPTMAMSICPPPSTLYAMYPPSNVLAYRVSGTDRSMTAIVFSHTGRAINSGRKAEPRWDGAYRPIAYRVALLIA